MYYEVKYESQSKFAERYYSYYIPQTPIYIEDIPKYPVRGVMLDLSRHFISVESIKRVIDGLMYSKMNTLHLHITDDDSFPLHSDVYPDLRNGAFS